MCSYSLPTDSTCTASTSPDIVFCSLHLELTCNVLATKNSGHTLRIQTASHGRVQHALEFSRLPSLVLTADSLGCLSSSRIRRHSPLVCTGLLLVARNRYRARRNRSKG